MHKPWFGDVSCIGFISLILQTIQTSVDSASLIHHVSVLAGPVANATVEAALWKQTINEARKPVFCPVEATVLPCGSPKHIKN